IQGAAAELFKMWAVTMRARGSSLDAPIVLCLHDELLIHVPAGHAEAAASLVGDCLAETARRWAPRGDVRFIAHVSVVRSWAAAPERAFHRRRQRGPQRGRREVNRADSAAPGRMRAPAGGRGW